MHFTFCIKCIETCKHSAQKVCMWTGDKWAITVKTLQVNQSANKYICKYICKLCMEVQVTFGYWKQIVWSSKNHGPETNEQHNLPILKVCNFSVHCSEAGKYQGESHLAYFTFNFSPSHKVVVWPAARFHHGVIRQPNEECATRKALQGPGKNPAREKWSVNQAEPWEEEKRENKITTAQSAAVWKTWAFWVTALNLLRIFTHFTAYMLFSLHIHSSCLQQGDLYCIIQREREKDSIQVYCLAPFNGCSKLQIPCLASIMWALCNQSESVNLFLEMLSK